MKRSISEGGYFKGLKNNIQRRLMMENSKATGPKMLMTVIYVWLR